jgi:glutathione S-transferase
MKEGGRQMSGITVHGIPGSPFLRSVEITLKEKDVPYHLRAMSPADMKTPEHLQLHPFGRIPMFEQDDFRLYETQAIMRYVDECFPHPPLTPGTPRQRARMNQVIGIIEWYFFPKASAPIGFNRIIAPRLLGMPGDEQAVADALPMARTCVTEFERLLGDQLYFTGNSASLADIMLAAQLDLFGECAEGRELVESAPKLSAWLERMLARPSFAATRPPEVLREAA